jgi:queuine tRNA-ribosyltransferase
MDFKITAKDPDSRARTGVIETPNGKVETPAYVIVATKASVRSLEPGDLATTETQMVISNTYHLWQSWGDQLADFPGIREELGWNGVTMTDSGGFQVFSLGTLRDEGRRRGGQESEVRGIVEVSEGGATFSDPDYGGEPQYLDPELSLRIQEQIGADIVVALDEPSAPFHSEEYTKESVRRTHAWALRALAAHTSGQALYAVVQGGAYEELRRESAKTLGVLPFDGYAIGGTYGDAYGGTKAETSQMIRWATDHLPESRPRHLFGVGELDDLVDGVEGGIDTFDCVIPTREGRHGRIWTHQGYYDVTRGSMLDRHEPLEEGCMCPPCSSGATKAIVKERFLAKDPEGPRLATMHNIWFFNVFMSEMREAIKEGKLKEFRARLPKKMQQ